MNCVEAAVERVVKGRKAIFLASIRLALVTPEHLSQLLPQPHSEKQVRDYLKAVAERLTAR
jgi:hypothetical protein